MQEHKESSSEPNPVYGGHSRLPADGGAPLYGTALKSAEGENKRYCLEKSIVLTQNPMTL